MQANTTGLDALFITGNRSPEVANPMLWIGYILTFKSVFSDAQACNDRFSATLRTWSHLHLQLQ